MPTKNIIGVGLWRLSVAPAGNDLAIIDDVRDFVHVLSVDEFQHASG